MKSIESLLKLSLKRKPKRLTYESTYSHNNILEWLKDILPSWEICIPIWKNEELSSALADWPPNNIRDGVKQWLEVDSCLVVDVSG